MASVVPGVNALSGFREDARAAVHVHCLTTATTCRSVSFHRMSVGARGTD